MGQRAGSVEHADVRRDALGELLPGVRVEREVTGEQAAEAVEQEDHGADDGQQRSPPVEAAQPDQRRGQHLSASLQHAAQSSGRDTPT